MHSFLVNKLLQVITLALATCLSFIYPSEENKMKYSHSFKYGGYFATGSKKMQLPLNSLCIYRML